LSGLVCRTMHTDPRYDSVCPLESVQTLLVALVASIGAAMASR
jgi:hypothetical protein